MGDLDRNEPKNRNMQDIDSTMEDADEVKHPLPEGLGLFLAVLGVGILILAWPMIAWLRANADDSALLSIIATIPFGILAVAIFSRTGPKSTWSATFAWGVLIAFVGASLLTWTSASASILIPIAFSLCFMSIGLYLFDSYSHARVALLASIALLPAFFSTPMWREFKTSLYYLIARLTSAMFDGIEIPNARIGQSIRTVLAEFDVASSATGMLSIEVVLAIAILFFLIRRTPFFVLILSAFAILGVWISLQSTYWSLGTKMEQSSSITRATFEWIPNIVFVLSLIAIPILEFFIRAFFAPIPPDAIATEFPLFIDLYNLSVRYPDRGLLAFGDEVAVSRVELDEEDYQ